MVPNNAPKPRRDSLIQSVISRRTAVSHVARRHLKSKQNSSLQHKWMRRLALRVVERRTRALWFQKVEAVAFHTRFASRNLGALRTLALCAAVPPTVPTIVATSTRTAISHGSSAPETDAPTTATSAVSQATALPVATLPAPTLTIESAQPQTQSAAAANETAVQTAVRVIADGRERKTSVTLAPDATVAHALQELNIVLADTDRVWPALNSPAKNGMSIRVTRVRIETRKSRTSIPFETLYQPTAELRPAARKTVQSGLVGAREVTEKIWSREGKVSSRETVSTRVVRAPRPHIVALGSRRAYLPGRIPYHNRYARAYTLAARGGLGRERLAMQIPATMKPLRAVRSLTLVATGYSPDPRENGGYTTTATGLPIGYGAAAVDPRVIPLGTKLYIEGYGYAFATDTGGAIKGHRIDLAYDSYRLANTKGRKKVRAWILQ